MKWIIRIEYQEPRHWTMAASTDDVETDPIDLGSYFTTDDAMKAFRTLKAVFAVTENPEIDDPRKVT